MFCIPNNGLCMSEYANELGVTLDTCKLLGNSDIIVWDIMGVLWPRPYAVIFRGTVGVG